MSRIDAIQQYNAAYRHGVKFYNTCIAQGKSPYPPVLDDIANETQISGQQVIGIVEIPLNAKGKLDVGGAVGAGTLSVIKDLGLKEPYVGTIPLVSGEIAEDIANYYVTSEQIPTVLSLGVLVAPDLTVQHAGGFLIQLLPFADEACIPVLEKNIAAMPHFTEMLKAGMTAEEIVLKCLDGLDPNLLDEAEPQYFCDCSRERTSRILISIGKDELHKLADSGENIEVCCHFCDKKYVFTPEEILSLMEQSKA